MTVDESFEHSAKRDDERDLADNLDELRLRAMRRVRERAKARVRGEIRAALDSWPRSGAVDS